jgi:hypothetical protein
MELELATKAVSIIAMATSAGVALYYAGEAKDIETFFVK